MPTVPETATDPGLGMMLTLVAPDALQVAVRLLPTATFVFGVIENVGTPSDVQSAGQEGEAVTVTFAGIFCPEFP